MEVVNNNSIIFKNIYVSCMADDGRVSIVKTDICMDVPKLIFENNGNIDALYQYTLIGNKGIDVQVPGAIKTQGSIYAGADETGKGGLQIGKDTVAATQMTMENALRVISKGDITVDPVSSLLVRDVAGQDTRVYAKNITLNSATASLDSKVYVANDLTLDGVGSRVALTKEYYGYGDSTANGLPGEVMAVDSAASSAIIINGRDSTVDMSSVTRLLIAGRSYIGSPTGNAAGDGNYMKDPADPANKVQTVPVMMGESIAVKGGQVAYLVPAECIGTLEGESEIGQNPINGDKESDITDFKTAYGSDFKEVDFDRKVYRLGGKTLRQMGLGASPVDGKANDAEDMKYIRKVYAPYKGGTLLYYYLVMDKDTAEKYFVQYYDFHANREEVDTYFNRYLSGGFQLGDFEDAKTEYTILGNSLISSALTDSGVTLLTGIDQTTLNLTGTPEGGSVPDGGTDPAAPVDPDAYTETGENAEEVTSDRDDAAVGTLIADIKKEYTSLVYNLMEDGSVPAFANPELPSDYDPVAASEYVFKSIIKCKESGGSTDNVEDYLDGLDGGKTHVTYKTSTGLQAHLAKDSVSLSGITGVDPTKLRLLVCLGDVTVDRDFTGLIIAKGKITVTGGSTIKLGGTELADVLQADSEFYNAADPTDPASDNRKPIDMFHNAGGSLLNGAQAPDVDDAGNLALDYSEIVRYMNWIKK